MKNLPYKSITAWKWIKDYCNSAKFIVKVDDDTFVNTYSLSEFIEYLVINHNSVSNGYFCQILDKERVDRRKHGKYSITCDEYDKPYYEPYCCGVANIITSDLIPKLYNAAYNSKYFWVDDVYVGFITRSLNVNMYNISNSILEKRRSLKENYLFIKNINNCQELVVNWDVVKRQNKKKNNKKLVHKDYSKWKNII